jgi:hypothetical protein
MEGFTPISWSQKAVGIRRTDPQELMGITDGIDGNPR